MNKNTPLVLISIFFFACTARSEAKNAEETMRSFFTALANRDYGTAVSLYNGDYQALIQMNPSISPTDYAALWKNGCEFNGFQCMEVMDIVQTVESDSQTKFLVTFKTKDGELFQFNGCCGETLPEPITEYEVLVQKDADGNYKVFSLPPYIP